MWGLSSPHGAPFPRSLCFPAGLKTWLGKSKKHKKTEAFYRLWFAHPLIGFVATWEFKKQTNLSQNHCNKISIFTFFHLKFIIRKRKCGYAYTESCVEKTNFGSTNLQIRKHQPTKAQPNPSVGDRDVHLWITALAELHCSSLVWVNYGHTSHKPLWRHHTGKIPNAFQTLNCFIEQEMWDSIHDAEESCTKFSVYLGTWRSTSTSSPHSTLAGATPPQHRSLTWGPKLQQQRNF